MNLFNETRSYNKNFDYNQSFETENYKTVTYTNSQQNVKTYSSHNPRNNLADDINIDLPINNDLNKISRNFNRNYEMTSLDSLVEYLNVNNLEYIEFDDINYINVRTYEFFNFYGLLKEHSNSSWSIIKG